MIRNGQSGPHRQRRYVVVVRCPPPKKGSESRHAEFKRLIRNFPPVSESDKASDPEEFLTESEIRHPDTTVETSSRSRDQESIWTSQRISSSEASSGSSPATPPDTSPLTEAFSLKSSRRAKSSVKSKDQKPLLNVTLCSQPTLPNSLKKRSKECAQAVKQPLRKAKMARDSHKPVQSARKAKPPPLILPALNGQSASQRKLTTESPCATQTQPPSASTQRQQRKHHQYDIPHFNYPQPWDQACQERWIEGCRACEKPDGSVDSFDVMNWIMMRNGGVKSSWRALEEAQESIRQLRYETLDLAAIRSEVVEEYEEEVEREKRREARRQALSNRFRSRFERQNARNHTSRGASRGGAAAPDKNGGGN